MANFPSLRPSVRTWTPAAPPMQTFTSQSGYEVRVRYGSVNVGSKLSLAFDNLLEADANSITAHYLGQQGSFTEFDLPSTLFAGMTDSSGITPSGSKWRYGAPPTVSYVAPGIASVSVELVSVPV